MKPRHRLTTTCLCVDSNNKYAYSGSKDGSLIKWNIKTSKLEIKISGIGSKAISNDETLKKSHHHRSINSVAISFDNNYLVSGGFDRLIRVWNPENLNLINTLQGHRAEITSLTFRRNHPHLYSASIDKSIKRWSLEEEESMTYLESLFGHEAAITSIDALRKERILSSGMDLSIRLFKIVDGAQSVFMDSSCVEVVRLIDDRAFVSGNEAGTISIWTTAKRSPICSIHEAHKLDENSTNNYLKNIEGINSFEKLNKFPVLSLDIFVDAKDREFHDHAVKQEDTLTHEDSDDSESDSIEKEEKEDMVVKNCTILLASGSFDSFIRIWRITIKGSKYSIELFRSIKCPGFVNDLKFSIDGTEIIAAIGQEHKSGRWWKIHGIKNCVKTFSIEERENQAALKRKKTPTKKNKSTNKRKK